MTTLTDILPPEDHMSRVKCLWRVAVEKTTKPKDYPMSCQLCRGYGIYDHKYCPTYQIIESEVIK